MNSLTLSIVIPLFNSEKYIEDTLLSLINQTEKNFELLIIDDGSTDNSVKVTEDFLKNHSFIDAKLLIKRPSEFPKGVSGARNYGIHISNGEWICFLDSDDLFHPEKVEILYSHFKQLNNSVKSIYHPQQEFTDGEKVTFVGINRAIPSEVQDVIGQLVTHNFITTSSVCINKTLFADNGNFDPDLAGVEDYYLWLQLSKRSKWLYIPHKITAYRVRNDSLMGARKMGYYVNQNDRLVQKVYSNPLFNQIEKKQVNQYFMKNLMKYYSGISLNKYGWLDFINGICALIKRGYTITGIKILFTQLRFLGLRKAGLLISRSKKSQ